MQVDYVRGLAFLQQTGKGYVGFDKRSRVRRDLQDSIRKTAIGELLRQPAGARTGHNIEATLGMQQPCQIENVGCNANQVG